MNKELLLNMRKFVVPEIVYGKGALQLVGQHAVNFGATQVLIVTDPGVQKAGWTQKVEQSLQRWKLPYCVFNSVTPNPRDYEVMDGAEMCRRNKCDLIIAVGGGSPMDCAKGIGVVAGNEGHISDFAGVDEIPEPGPPLIFIPTTAGTSADISQFAIISDTIRQIKIVIISKMVVPELALVDPETTVTMPPELTANTGMDALCHALEAYVSTTASPLTDMAATTAIQHVVDYLPGAFAEPKNLIYRDKMMMASLMAGLAFSNASLGLVHAMAHSLGGLFDLPHGHCNAILLDQVIRYNYPVASDKYDTLAPILRIADPVTGENLRKIEEKIIDLRKTLKITNSWQNLLKSPANISLLAEKSMSDLCAATNPRIPDLNDVKMLFKQLYQSDT